MSLCTKSFLLKWLFGSGFVPLLPPFRKALKEIVIQQIADFKQQIGINPFAAEEFVDILSRVVELCGQPSNATALPSQFCFDEFPYVRFFVHRFAFAWSLARWANKTGGTVLIAYLIIAALVNRWSK